MSNPTFKDLRKGDRFKLPSGKKFKEVLHVRKLNDEDEYVLVFYQGISDRFRLSGLKQCIGSATQEIIIGRYKWDVAFSKGKKPGKFIGVFWTYQESKDELEKYLKKKYGESTEILAAYLSDSHKENTKGPGK